MMDALRIKILRPGANGGNRNAANAANYDESKVDPYILPEPLVCKDGTKVETADLWWTRRCPEIFEDFDREVYGRVPRDVPALKWEMTATTEEKVGEIAAVTKKLVGDVDNTRYPQISVDIQLSLTTPASAQGPVPLMMELGFVSQSAFRLMTSTQAREAFDLSQELTATRELYGMTRFGQSCLLARRRIEGGVRFVTINAFLTVSDEITWDIHGSKPFTSIEGRGTSSARGTTSRIRP